MKGDKYILGISGGKDSTAMILEMLYERNVSIDKLEFVFLDTGWESEITYQYIKYLEKELNIDIKKLQAKYTIKDEHKEVYSKIVTILGKESNMVKQILNQKMFPSGYAQWCTRQLKIKPLKDYFNTIDFDPINTIGIRREESKRRSKMTEYEFSDYLDCWVYRPILDMKIDQVIQLHHKYNILPNDLYIKGNQQRVGCYPCIRSNKKELANFNDKKIIQVIKILEEYISEKREKQCTFFKSGKIEDVLEWSRTSRGGKQFYLFNLNAPECKKWGMCGI